MGIRERKYLQYRLDDVINSIIDNVTFSCGGRSSVGRALGCDPSRRGFESRRSPHLPFTYINVLLFRHFSWAGVQPPFAP